MIRGCQQVGEDLENYARLEARRDYRRLAKVIFGADGSYYATIPYHKSRNATVLKMTDELRRWHFLRVVI